jgi:rhodanese-related sulfurtransferase
MIEEIPDLLQSLIAPQLEGIKGEFKLRNCGRSYKLAAARPAVTCCMPAERIPIPELKKKVDDKKVVVVDVREASEVKESGVIPGAMHIPMAHIEKRMSEIPKTAEVVLYCGGGGRASRAAEAFVKAGYKTVHFCGLRDWKRQGLPTEQR